MIKDFLKNLPPVVCAKYIPLSIGRVGGRKGNLCQSSHNAAMGDPMKGGTLRRRRRSAAQF